MKITVMVRRPPRFWIAWLTIFVSFQATVAFAAKDGGPPLRELSREEIDKKIVEIRAREERPDDPKFQGKVRDPRLYAKEGSFLVRIRLPDNTDPHEWLTLYSSKVDVVDVAFRGDGRSTDENGEEPFLSRSVRVDMIIDQRTLIELEGDETVTKIIDIGNSSLTKLELGVSDE